MIQAKTKALILLVILKNNTFPKGHETLIYEGLKK